jgi:hypothetical protein
MDILYGEFMGNFQKQTFIECDRPDKRRVSYESRRPWFRVSENENITAS